MFGLSFRQSDLFAWADALHELTAGPDRIVWQDVQAEEGVRVEYARLADGGLRVRGQAVLRASCDDALRLLRAEYLSEDVFRTESLAFGCLQVELSTPERKALHTLCRLTPITEHHTQFVLQQTYAVGQVGEVGLRQSAVEQCRELILRLRSAARVQTPSAYG